MDSDGDGINDAEDNDDDNDGIDDDGILNFSQNWLIEMKIIEIFIAEDEDDDGDGVDDEDEDWDGDGLSNKG